MTAQITNDALMEKLRRRGLSDAATAGTALRSTLAVLGERLVDDEAQTLAEVLPERLAAILTTPSTMRISTPKSSTRVWGAAMACR